MIGSIAFCNDIDFADYPTYKEYHRELNDIGIETGDSFFLFDPSDWGMSLFKSTVKEKTRYHDELLEDIYNGKLNIIHSSNFNKEETEKTPNREMFAEALEYLKKHARVPAIWTNHGDSGNIQSIASKKRRTYELGGVPNSKCYILDILINYGVRFYWTTGNVCYEQFVLGQSRKHTDKMVDARRNQMSRGIRFIKRCMKRERTPFLEKVETDSGIITTFNRYNGNQLKRGPDAQTLYKQLTPNNLEELHKKQGYCVIYNHFGTHRDSNGKPFTAKRPVFPPESKSTLQYLSKMHSQNKIRIMNLLDMLVEAENRMNEYEN